MGRIALSIACAVAGLTLGSLLNLGSSASAAGGSDSPTPPIQAEAPATLVDKEYGYQIQAPRFPGAKGASQTRMIVLGPVAAGFSPNVVVTVDEKPARKMADFCQETRKGLEKSGYKIIGNTQILRRNGHSTAIINADAHLSGNDVRQRFVIFHDGSRAVTAVATALQSNFADYEDCFDECLKSLRMMGSLDVGTSPKATPWVSDKEEEKTGAGTDSKSGGAPAKTDSEPAKTEAKTAKASGKTEEKTS